MNVQEACQTVEDAVKVILAGKTTVRGRVWINDSARKYVEGLTPGAFGLLTEAIDLAQEQGLVLLDTSLTSEFPAESTLKGQMRNYMKMLLTQEGYKALGR